MPASLYFDENDPEKKHEQLNKFQMIWKQGMSWRKLGKDSKRHYYFPFPSYPAPVMEILQIVFSTKRLFQQHGSQNIPKNRAKCFSNKT